MRDDVKNLFKEYVERNQPGAFYDFAASLAGLE
jgi:hypothetical protein